jgi:hypothetical protein
MGWQFSVTPEEPLPVLELELVQAQAELPAASEALLARLPAAALPPEAGSLLLQPRATQRAAWLP